MAASVQCCNHANGHPSTAMNLMTMITFEVTVTILLCCSDSSVRRSRCSECSRAASSAALLRRVRCQRPLQPPRPAWLGTEELDSKTGLPQSQPSARPRSTGSASVQWNSRVLEVEPLNFEPQSWPSVPSRRSRPARPSRLLMMEQSRGAARRIQFKFFRRTLLKVEIFFLITAT